ncbi:hypothetical protein D770_03740 [Flammeovirgaceae bacterium 311]|nr:hypothetical protein D770_03740 [Flammeovirgaceae bacterium 311]
MNLSKLLRQSLPHLVAVVLYVAVSILFFSPATLDNKVLFQNDILQAEGGNREIVTYRQNTGEEPLWTNSMFGGMPAYLLSVEYSGDLMTVFLRILYLGLTHPANLTFAAMLCFYILLVCAEVRPWLALAGGLAYGLSTFLLISIEAGHNSKVLAMAVMPLVVAGVLLVFRNRKVWGFVLTALGLALQLRAGHPQITYYLFLMLVVFGIVWLVYAIRDNTVAQLFKNVGILVVAALLAVGCNWGRLYNIYQYGKYSIRGASELTAQDPGAAGGTGLDREYAFAWSSGRAESLTLLVPYFYGGASTESVGRDSELAESLERQGVPPEQVNQFVQQVPTYFGDQPFTSGPIYVGAVICFLFFLGLWMAPPEYRYWLLAATILSLVLSWGKNLQWFNYLVFDYVPGYNKFRAVTMALSIALLTIPLLGFIGLEYFCRESGAARARRGLFIAAGITGGLSLLIALFAGMRSYTGLVDAQLAGYPEWIMSAIQEQREALVRGDAYRSFFFIIAAAAVCYFIWLKKINPLVGAASVGLLLLIDLWAVDTRYFDESNYSRNPRAQFFSENAADQAVLADTDPHFRVLNLMNPFQDGRTSYFHRSVGGYHGAKLRRYQDLIERVLQPEMQMLISSLQQGNPDFEQADALNMLDTRYLLAGQQREAVIRNPAALGAAWLVEDVKTVSSPDEEIEQLLEIDTRTTAVINTERFPLQNQSYNGGGSIQLTQYGPNRITYQAETSGNALAVFSEIYYPEGWIATVNGQEANIIQANYVLRALELPAGNHTVEFRFEPASYSSGNIVMLVCNIILILLLLGAIGWSIKNGSRHYSAPAESRA